MNRTILLTTVLMASLLSCVSIKPSTVQLSAQVGERLAEMEKLHQLAIQRYFDMEKQKIEDFLTGTWEPLFLKNFLGTSGVLTMLQNVSTIDPQGRSALREGLASYLTDTSEAGRATDDLIKALNSSRKGEENLVRTTLKKYVEDQSLDAVVIHVSSLLGTDEPARIIFEFTEAAHHEMQARRKDLVAPIDQARAEASATLSEAYAELIRGQSTITGRLEAAAKVSKQQDELLGKLGVDSVSEKLTGKLSAISARVNSALSKAGELIKNVDKDNSNEIINALKEALNTTEEDKK